MLSAPELEGPDAHDYEIISHKVTYRLAERPGSQVASKYTRPVLKKNPVNASLPPRRQPMCWTSVLPT